MNIYESNPEYKKIHLSELEAGQYGMVDNYIETCVLDVPGGYIYQFFNDNGENTSISTQFIKEKDVQHHDYYCYIFVENINDENL